MSEMEEYNRISNLLRSGKPGEYVINGQFVEFRSYFPLVERIISICVVPDKTIDPQNVISDRQIRLIARTLQMRNGLQKIKELVFSDYLDCQRSDENETKDNLDSAYALVCAESLFVLEDDYSGWPANQCLLHFGAPWDSEHGIGIRIIDSEVVGLGDF